MHFMEEIRSTSDKRRGRENRNVVVWMKTHTMPYAKLCSYKGRQIAANDLEMSVGRFTKALGRVMGYGMGRKGKSTPEAFKGRNRNKPCPCGSGEKTKHCCGGIHGPV